MSGPVAEAQAAQARGALSEAIEILGRALWEAPEDAALQRAADALAAAVDVEQQLPLKLGMKAHAGAMRARLLAAQGELDEALQLLLQLAPIDPQVAYLPWALGWLSDAPRAASVDVDALLSSLAGVQRALTLDSDAHIDQWGHIAALLRRLHQVHDGHAHLPSMLALALRNAGRHAESVGFAEAAYAAAPGFVTAVALAGALRGIGDVDAAVSAYERAQGHAPEQPGPGLDIGDMLADAGRYPEALRRYEAVLAQHPEHPWATASAHYIRHRLGERSARYALLRQWIDQPEHPRVRQLARQTTPWVGYLLSPWEALVRYAEAMTPEQLRSLRRQALASLPPGADPGDLVYRLDMGRPEAPSAQLVARGALAGSGVSLTVAVEGIPHPDPRQPRADDLRWALWRFDGDDAFPALPAPTGSQLPDLVAALASRGDSLDFAGRAGRWLADSQPPPDALLATMVHPPPPPEGVPAWDWLPRVQRICAMALASLGDGWEGTVRRDALRALILGASDWSVAAGAWAAVALAEHDGTGALETLDWILTRLRAEPIDVFCGQTYPLALAAFFHPSLSADGRRSLLDLIERAEGLLAG